MTLRGTIALLLALSSAAVAQQRPAGAGGGEGRGGGGGGAGEQRAQLEARFRQQFARVVQARVGLTEAQMTRLAPINDRYAAQRRQIQTHERSTRTALQRALRDPAAADSGDVSRLLQQLVEAQKRRIALLEAEQRELATIMTPIQRARYMALQEQVRRQVEQRRGGGGQGQGRRRPPPR